jgi:hypothetical protein
MRPCCRDEAWSASLWQTFFTTSVGAQIPLVTAPCGNAALGLCLQEVSDRCSWCDHLCTCTAHSGAKRAHDWAVDQIADLFRTTHKVKMQKVARSRGQRCGDIELAGYLANAAGPVPLVLDLRIAHERFGSWSDLNVNGHVH